MIISAIVFALLLGAFIFLILRVPAWRGEPLSVAIFVVLIGVIYGGSIELLGRPKPLRLGGAARRMPRCWRDAGRERGDLCLAGHAGASEPCAYVLPWSLEAAQQLQDAMNQAEADGTAC